MRRNSGAREHSMAKTATRTIDLAPIDRLEEKVKALVTLVERLKADAARLSEDNARLSREVEALHTRLADAESASGELVALREERDLVRMRVAEMLEQLEGITV
ncbi:MAG TPA: cell division protein ZapB [Vicinamibacterales bacterium]